MLQFCLLLLIAATPVWAAKAIPKRAPSSMRRGSIYEKDTGRKQLLFKYELKIVKEENGVREEEGIYTDTNGRVLVKESIVYEREQLKSYTAEYTQFSAKDSVERRDGKFIFTRVNDGKVKSGEEKVEGEALVGPQLEAFVQRNWKLLMEGEVVRFKFIAVGNGSTVDFKLKKEADIKYNGQPAVDVKMYPSGFFAALAARGGVHLIFAADEPHSVLAYIGRTMPRKEENGSLREVDAEIVYAP